jgi:hypothetical protein
MRALNLFRFSEGVLVMESKTDVNISLAIFSLVAIFLAGNIHYIINMEPSDEYPPLGNIPSIINGFAERGDRHDKN